MAEEGAPTKVMPEGRGKYGTTTLLSVPGVSLVAMSTAAYTKDLVYYFPIRVKTPITVDQVTIAITAGGASGKKGRIAIYNADLDWQPGALIVASAEFSIASNAVVNTAIAETALQEGNYLLALTLEASLTLVRTTYGDTTFGYMPTISISCVPVKISVAKSYAALADPGTAWDTVDSGDGGIRQSIFLRVKTP